MVEEEHTRRKLCTKVMKDEWDKVLKIYKKKLDDHELTMDLLLMTITQSGDTTLHKAIYNDDYKNLEKLVEFIELVEKETEQGRDWWQKELADDTGNTPLHLAAKMGRVKMCYKIANSTSTVLSGLLICRNNEGETPIFVAALHGKTRAFLALCNVSHTKAGKDKWDYSEIQKYCRRTDGNTVLHCAIDGEYFGLAYQIIARFPDFAHCVEERGYLPLHILASKHSSFESNSGLTWWQKLIYKGVLADKPRVTEYFRPSHDHDDDDDAGEHRKPKRTDVENPPPSAQTNSTDRHCFVSKNCRDIKHWGFKHLLPQDIVEMKKKHLWALKIKSSLLSRACYYEYLHAGGKPTSRYKSNFNEWMLIPKKKQKTKETPIAKSDIKEKVVAILGEFLGARDDANSAGEQNKQETPIAKSDIKQIMEPILDKFLAARDDVNSEGKKETPILIAAKNGVQEIVEDILHKFPAAIHDVDSEGKNLILLTAENRQPQICEWLIKQYKEKQTLTKDLFLGLDKDGNSALHLAAMLKNYQPWLAPNAVLQMQWEIKWFEYIKKQMPKHMSGHKNNKGKIAEEIFLEEHSELVKNDTEWLMKTAESCSIVATLIATVAFTTSVSVPGGTESGGEPVLRKEPMFEIFSISSLLAVCFSLTAVVMFLAILTSRRQARDFGKSLPIKLLIGLTALFLSIASVLVFFCGGHFFVLKNVLKDAKVAEYAVVVITLLVFAIAQFPLYFKHILATFKQVPERGFMVKKARISKVQAQSQEGRVSQVQTQSQEGPSQPSPN